jgi:CPA2 family monovalent cation:H+ antiporter-2
LITTLAAGFGLALVFGFIAARLKLPALVGYLAAGIIIGPAMPGRVAHAEIASQLAEVGVMLPMFGVGLHFSIDDLHAVRKIAPAGAVVQMLVATALGVGVAHLRGWPLGSALVFGIYLSVAPIVMLLKALESRGDTESGNGRDALGWLVVEDLAMVLAVVLLSALAPSLGGKAIEASTHATATTILMTLAQVGGFIVFMLIVACRLFPWVLWQIAKTGSRELFTLCVIAAAVSIADGSAPSFGVSFALGAFFAGLVCCASPNSARGPRNRDCRCKTRSRCCSSTPSACRGAQPQHRGGRAARTRWCRHGVRRRERAREGDDAVRARTCGALGDVTRG